MYGNLITPGEIPLSLFILFSFLCLIQLCYYFFFFIRFARFRNPADQEMKVPVSVVICAHNEYLNLRENLPLILEQDYPEFEVLVVNHASDDDTSFLLSDIQRQYPRLKLIEIQKDLNFFSGKKFPLSIGIRSARYEKILLTDADCKPSSRNWITHMVSAYRDHTSIVLGFSPYTRFRGVLNKIIRYDTAHIALQYLSYALSGIPYMGVGRNLSYQKSLFIGNQGFISHYRINSGDDDLFINRVADSRNTAIVVHPGSFMTSDPKRKFSQWFFQKRRHISTSAHYRPLHKFLLGIYSLSLLAYYTLFALLLALNISPFSVIGIFLIRMITQYLIFSASFRRLNEKDLIPFIPVMEIVLLLLNVSLGVTNLFSRSKTWK